MKNISYLLHVSVHAFLEQDQSEVVVATVKDIIDIVAHASQRASSKHETRITI